MFGGLAAASANYQAGGFGVPAAPAGSDSAQGDALLAEYFPRAAANPADLVFKLGAPAWQPAEAASPGTATAQLTASRVLRGVTGPLDPAGMAITPAQFTRLYGRFGPPSGLTSPRPTAAPSSLLSGSRSATRAGAPEGISPPNGSASGGLQLAGRPVGG